MQGAVLANHGCLEARVDWLVRPELWTYCHSFCGVDSACQRPDETAIGCAQCNALGGGRSDPIRRTIPATDMAGGAFSLRMKVPKLCRLGGTIVVTAFASDYRSSGWWLRS